jgi:hypothetical protein
LISGLRSLLDVIGFGFDTAPDDFLLTVLAEKGGAHLASERFPTKAKAERARVRLVSIVEGATDPVSIDWQHELTLLRNLTDSS